MENPVILYVYDVENFAELELEENTNVRILRRENSDRPILFGFLDLNNDTYEVIRNEELQNVDLDNLQGQDVLIGIESSDHSEAGSVGRFVLETIRP